MEILTKEQLIHRLQQIRDGGWVRNARPGNAGGVGNTLEDLLGITENNLPIPNAAEWELKCQRTRTSSLTTLFHMEPSPRVLRLVPSLLLPKYGWRHEHLADEMSFRQTINGASRTDRGFAVLVDRAARKVVISFDAAAVDVRHSAWLRWVAERVGLGEIDPQPYWGFDDLFHKAGTKLGSCFYVRAQAKREGDVEYFLYDEICVLESFSLERFVDAIESGAVLIDFDARTHHNHGTKFRLRRDRLPDLYATVTRI